MHVCSFLPSWTVVWISATVNVCTLLTSAFCLMRKWICFYQKFRKSRTMNRKTICSPNLCVYYDNKMKQSNCNLLSTELVFNLWCCDEILVFSFTSIIFTPLKKKAYSKKDIMMVTPEARREDEIIKKRATEQTETGNERKFALFQIFSSSFCLGL